MKSNQSVINKKTECACPMCGRVFSGVDHFQVKTCSFCQQKVRIIQDLSGDLYGFALDPETGLEISSEELFKKVFRDSNTIEKLFGKISGQGEAITLDTGGIYKPMLEKFLHQGLGTSSSRKDLAVRMFPKKPRGYLQAAKNWDLAGWNILTALGIEEKGSEIDGETPEKYKRIAADLMGRLLPDWAFGSK